MAWVAIMRRMQVAALTDGDIAVWTLQHLVHALGPEGGPQDAGNSLGSHDAGLDRVHTLHPGLLILLLCTCNMQPDCSFSCCAETSKAGLCDEPTRMMIKGRPYSSNARDILAAACQWTLLPISPPAKNRTQIVQGVRAGAI